MASGFQLVLAALAQAAVAGPPAPAVAPATAAAAAAPATAAQARKVPPPDRPDGCDAQTAAGDSRTIVVCAPKPQGYRIDPDVLEARREARAHVQPRRPDAETMQVNSCALVGPMGCRGNVGIDLASAAMVLGEMAKRAIEGGNVGQMFVTEPQEGEYQLYVDAKKRREAKEAQAAAAKAKAAAVAPRTGSTAPAPQPSPMPQAGAN
ncbi:hypothetical protein [Sphingomonas sp.]|uniref:hypothetical protein n=1 Tax=Sphingomonas sp. TaxID=28214 RepID=UPI0025EF8042|nr:hypothetical protein [Sphingomonas sp.]MBV9528545.1 hypothetical protein [Sphingomonas sp.]